MKIVYVLFAICVKNPTIFSGTIRMDTSIAVFETSERCLKVLEVNKKTLEKEYDQVTIECKRKELYE